MKELQELVIKTLKEKLKDNPNDSVGINTLTNLLDRVTYALLREDGK